MTTTDWYTQFDYEWNLLLNWAPFAEDAGVAKISATAGLLAVESAQTAVDQAQTALDVA